MESTLIKKEKLRAKDKQRNLLIIVTPDNECVGIKLKLNDGKITQSSIKEILDLKRQLESGAIRVEDVDQSKIIVNPDLKEERMDQIKFGKLICKCFLPIVISIILYLTAISFKFVLSIFCHKPYK